jgi:hypothetical protein
MFLCFFSVRQPLSVSVVKAWAGARARARAVDRAGRYYTFKSI